MEGFGVHTFRFINEKNESVFVKFHWKPLLGVHSVVWEEAQMISGKIRRAGMLPESVAEVLAVAPGSLLRETPFKKIEGRHDSDDARI